MVFEAEGGYMGDEVAGVLLNYGLVLLFGEWRCEDFKFSSLK